MGLYAGNCKNELPDSSYRGYLQGESYYVHNPADNSYSLYTYPEQQTADPSTTAEGSSPPLDEGVGTGGTAEESVKRRRIENSEERTEAEEKQEAKGLQDVSEAILHYPESSLSEQECKKQMREYGLDASSRSSKKMRNPSSNEKQKQLTNFLKQYIAGYLVANDHENALKLLEYWNKAYPEQRMTAEELGIKPVAAPQDAGPLVEQDPPAAPTRELTYNESVHNLSIFSREGGFHDLWSVTGKDPMVVTKVNGQMTPIDNGNILVRIPKPDGEAPCTVKEGLKAGADWVRNEFIIPEIYNRKTAEKDNFYIVEKVPHSFDPTKEVHRDQVKKCLN